MKVSAGTSSSGGAAAAAAGAAAAPAPPPPKEPLATLWVGSLQPNVTDDDLFDAFAPHGFVTDVNLTEQQSAAGGLQAHVKFSYRDEAEAALSASLNRQLLVKGKAVTCRWAQKDIVSIAQLKSAALQQQQQQPPSAPPPPPTGGRPPGTLLAGVPSAVSQHHHNVAGCNYIAPKIWIGNLPLGTSEVDLRSVCRGYGVELMDVIVHRKPSQYGQLSGFLRFKTQLETEMMLKAIASGAIVVRGAVMKADWAKGQQQPR